MNQSIDYMLLYQLLHLACSECDSFSVEIRGFVLLFLFFPVVDLPQPLIKNYQSIMEATLQSTP